MKSVKRAGRERVIEYMPLDGLKGAKRNPKNHDLGQLHASVERFGYAETMLLDERTGRLVAGHGRLATLRHLSEKGVRPPDGIKLDAAGEWLVPVTRGWASANDTEAEAYLITSNSSVEAGGWNDAELAEMLSDLAKKDALAGTGYDDDDVDKLLKDLDPNVDVVPEAPAESWVKPGDVFALGRHRLICGDSARFIDEPADVVVLDPPFNGSASLWARFLRDPCVLFGQVRHARLVPENLYRFERVIDKVNAHRSATTHIGQRHALVVQCGSVKKCPTSRETFPSVVTAPASEREDHRWEKPVALIVEHLTHWTPPWKVVLDPFAGSGSTIIAAETLGRKCVAIELEPGNVQVALERWEKLTDKKHERA